MTVKSLTGGIRMPEYLTALIKTLMELCYSRAQIIDMLIVNYSMPLRDAERLYHACLVEMGN